MTDARHPWTRRVSGFAFWLAIAAVLVALIGMTLARYDLIGKLPGFLSFLYMVPVAGVAGLIGLIGLIMNWRTGWPAARKALAGMVIGGGAFGAATLAMSPASQVPAIHDITTDLADVPSFTELTVPADNLRGVDTEEQWKEMHIEGYPDLDGINVDATPAEIIAKAEQLAQDRGWSIALADPAAGRLEAVSYASWIRFEDIVVLRAVANEDGGTRVDMRSVSRVGVSDLGENAKRIREFLAELQSA